MRHIHILTLALPMLLLSSCNKDDADSGYTQLSDRNIVVQSVSITTQGDPWASRAVGEGVTEMADALTLSDSVCVDLCDSLVMFAEQQMRGAVPPTESPISRGTPITSASAIPSLRIQLYNSGSVDWGTSTPLTDAIVAKRNANGSYTCVPAYNWSSQSDKITLLTLSPEPTADNGMTINGHQLDYTAPTDVTKQPDLCTANGERNVVNTDGLKHLRTIALSHRLTAIGFAVNGWNVKITKAEVTGVALGGTYDLSTSQWALNAPSTESRAASINSSTSPSDSYNPNKNWTNVTNTNGYLMLPPQRLTNDARANITYTDAAGKSQTINVQLNVMTGGEWVAGVKVTYNIQLKTAPPIGTGTVTLTMPWKAGYTTSSALAFGAKDPADRYKFTWSESWLKMHHGSATTGSVPSGATSGWMVDANSLGNLWFFAPADYTNTASNRTSSVTIEGNRTGARTFTVVQTFKPNITATPTTAVPNPIPGGGATYALKVVSNYPWTVSAKVGGVTTSIANGGTTTGTNVNVVVPANTGASNRTVSATFSTTNDRGTAALIANTTWSAAQDVNFSIDPSAPGETIPGIGKEYTVNVKSGSAWTVACGTGVTATPASGTGNAIVKLKVASNPSGSATRAVKADFKIGSAVMATWSGTQDKFPFSIDKNSPGEIIPGVGKEYTVNVTAGGAWTVVGSSGVTANPSSGTGNGVVKLTVEMSYDKAASKAVSAQFKEGSTVAATWSGTQAIGPRFKTTSPGETVPGYGKTYSVEILADGAWTIGDVDAGISHSQKSGTGNTTIQVVVGGNESVTSGRSLKFSLKVGASNAQLWSASQLLFDHVVIGRLKWKNMNVGSTAIYHYGQAYTSVNCPAGWRIPTKDEWRTLFAKKYWVTMAGGVRGLVGYGGLSSEGSIFQHVFVPAWSQFDGMSNGTGLIAMYGDNNKVQGTTWMAFGEEPGFEAGIMWPASVRCVQSVQ